MRVQSNTHGNGGINLTTQSKRNEPHRTRGFAVALRGFAGPVLRGLSPLSFLGEWRCMIGGLIISVTALTCFGLSTQGWMIYALIPLGALANLAPPSLQGLVSRQVPATEQGSLQGTLASLGSLAGVIAPPVAALAFGYCIDADHSWKLPGIAFFGAAALQVCALYLVLAAKKRMKSEN
ncbi:MAG TPA: hypothetical protein PL015_03925 [Opitutaceae bacterium]|nr:hypothetical protein [Opitutaceae bacterium]